ncbi:DUF1287 domain-containing protein [Vibrio sp. S9_S30]|uniref:DUF1287 domain-containing protein n=1 Tax=Vibrio sp. S9_S30 TaxID=2720226 RepID=UPI001933FEAB|nr:DUF1287 domain-containing protein [Vibrio sp. S9_S30]
MMSKLKFSALISLLSVSSVAYTAVTSPHGLVEAAMERTEHFVMYDGSYVSIPYPNGDVAANKGVCTDVIIRSYRTLGVDLQKQVHEDMKVHFDEYPSKRIWGLSRPDKNIDHRRVPNLQVFFKRHGKSLTVSTDGDNYLPGDMVTWMLPGNLPHIGIVVEQKSDDGKRPLIVHNIGWGPKMDDMLFDYKITGHYRYFP